MRVLATTNRSETIVGRALQIILILLLPVAAYGGTDKDDELEPHELVQGRIAFMQCSACHAVSAENDTGKLGPSLAGIFGRQAGSLTGYSNYSAALRDADFIWNPETIAAFLADPSGFVPGNLMAFAGIEDVEKRSLLVRYLRRITGTED